MAEHAAKGRNSKEMCEMYQGLWVAKVQAQLPTASAAAASAFPPCQRQFKPRAHCGSSVALCSSGSAAMISTSLGALLMRYLSWTCRSEQGGGRSGAGHS